MIHTPLPLEPAPQAKARFSPISYLMLALSDRCNLRCHYCFVNKTQRKMSKETARKAVDFFLHRNITGVNPEVAISFFGGEPFIELDLMEEVVRYARAARPDTRKRLSFAATTNATISGPRVERIIRDTRMELLVSVDGDERATSHRPFESGASSYRLVRTNLPKLVSWASAAIVRTTFHPAALNLVENVRHVLELGAPSVALAPVVESDWAGSEAGLEDAYQELADWFIAEARADRILPLEGTWGLLRQLDRARRGQDPPGRPCGVARELLGIDPDGNVMPCHRFLYRPDDWLGTVDRPQLSGARNRFLDVSSAALKECATCIARPVCGGGCRAVALQADLGLYGVHPGHCLTTRAHARAAYRIYDTLMADKEPNRSFVRVLRSGKNLGGALTELALR